MVEIRGKLTQITRLAVLAIFLLTAGCAHSPSPNTLLKFDPEVEKIQLKNGMEVWLRSTKTPKNEVHFLLRFEVGSVHERYSESGVAHLLEHLAFNGSKHFLKGTLDNQFKRHGLSLGTHQNASTGYFDTTYKLIIPPKKAVLRDTMLFFSDIAQNLTLSPSAVEQEKSVVLAETTTRSGLGERTAKRQIEFLFPGSRIAKRPIDGNERIIRKLDAASIKAFYRRWYRPDRTKLIIVGDIDNIRPYLRQQTQVLFADWRVQGPAPTDPELNIDYSLASKVNQFSDKEMTETKISIDRVAPSWDITNYGEFRHQIAWLAANSILEERFRVMLVTNPNLIYASIGGEDFGRHTWIYSSIIRASKGHWKPALQTLITAKRQASQFGFTVSEVELIKIRMIRSIKESIDITEDASSVVDWVTESLDNDEIFSNPRQDFRDWIKILKVLTKEELEAAYRLHDNSPQNERYLIQTGTNPKPPLAKEISATIRLANLKKVVRYQPILTNTTILAQEPRAGKIGSRTYDERTKVHSVKFANGVHLWVRRTELPKNTVEASVMFAGGVLQENAKNRGITDLASAILVQPATQSRSSKQMSVLKAYHDLWLSPSTSSASVLVEMTVAPDKLKQHFQFTHLILNKGQLDPSLAESWKIFNRSRHATSRNNVDSVAADYFENIFSGGDARFKSVTDQDGNNLTQEKTQAWFKKLVRAPMEVSIVGDIEPERAIELAARYLGSLPKRETVRNAYESIRIVNPFNKGPILKRLSVDTDTKKAAVYVGWRSVDPTDTINRTRLSRAAKILQSRLQKALREKMGLVYSVSVNNLSDWDYRNNSIFYAFAYASPKNVDKVGRVMKLEIERFAATGPTKQELDIARKQVQHSLDEDLPTAGHWWAVLYNFDYTNSKMSEVYSNSSDVPEYTPGDIKKSLGLIIRPSRNITVIAIPNS